jgi:hypothetical protein
LGEPRVKLNDEAREFRWVTLAEALEMEINQPTRKLLLAVNQIRESVGNRGAVR